ncbi:NADPH-dependent F420 reductase [Paramicrobacterium fandaimingii]|uniref:NADPH-dependent F420 reductase n=1 Tax=Paramicrobacterium fandaimingii TaxID=2708079 RepID=UPI001423F6C4|nr:NAD(P)-binding domain-containing protein [Microbacterium fandaimingii]
MTTMGIIGAGDVGSQLARAAIASGYTVVIANSRGPETLAELVAELGPSARAASAVEAAASGDFVVIAAPLTLTNTMPVTELAGKIVLDTNNYMRWRDGHFSVVASGERTIHELRQQQLPTSKVASAFTHIQAPTLLRFARHAGSPERLALATSSNHPDAVELVTELYDRLGYDTVDNSPVSESWRVGPGTRVWNRSLRGGQNRETLIAGLAAASAAWDE